MFYVRFAHSFETVGLNQFYNFPKACFHVCGQNFELISNAGIEQFNDPRHCL